MFFQAEEGTRAARECGGLGDGARGQPATAQGAGPGAGQPCRGGGAVSASPPSPQQQQVTIRDAHERVTAATEAQEFFDIYQPGVLTIPTHEPCIRDDANDSETDDCVRCRPSTCGDGVVQDHEARDDGNDSNTDACLNV